MDYCKKEKAEYQEKYKIKNKQVIKTYQQNYYIKNKKTINNYNNNYYKINKKELLFNQKIKRLIKKNKIIS